MLVAWVFIWEQTKEGRTVALSDRTGNVQLLEGVNNVLMKKKKKILKVRKQKEVIGRNVYFASQHKLHLSGKQSANLEDSNEIVALLTLLLPAFFSPRDPSATTAASCTGATPACGAR